MLSLRFGEMIGQARLDAAGEHGSPILLPFAAPGDDLVPIEIDVLHSQFETFLQPEPCSMTGPGRAPSGTEANLERLAGAEPGPGAGALLVGAIGSVSRAPLVQ